MRKYRHELKFIIKQNIAEILKQRLALIMNIDANSCNEDSTYLIRSLYFDDPNSTAYYQKVDGIEFRKKYRIRIYNYQDDFIRLECKYKHNQMTSKDSVRISKELCDCLVNGEWDVEFPDYPLLNQFVLEMKNRRLRPDVIVDYRRLAYTYPISDVRVTFDEKIRSGYYNYDLFDQNTVLYPVIDDFKVVVEVKFNDIIPEHIACILSSVPMFRQAVSKFALCREVK